MKWNLRVSIGVGICFKCVSILYYEFWKHFHKIMEMCYAFYQYRPCASTLSLWITVMTFIVNFYYEIYCKWACGDIFLNLMPLLTLHTVKLAIVTFCANSILNFMQVFLYQS